MAATLYFGDVTPSTPYRDSSGRPLAGAALTFWRSGTTEEAPVYTGPNLSEAFTQPIALNGAGVSLPIYLDPAVRYRVKLEDVRGRLVWDVDPYLKPADDAPAEHVEAFLTPNSNQYPSTNFAHKFTVPEGVESVDVLIVAGGGGGGTSGGGAGGGGGGGLVYLEGYEVTPEEVIDVWVALGAAAAGFGGRSYFDGIEVFGGGPGAQGAGAQSANGSAGGASGLNPGGVCETDQGNDGGAGGLMNDGGGSATFRRTGGGGGGAGEAGHPGKTGDDNPGDGGDGGNGLYFGDIFGDQYGDEGWFAGGGGGSAAVVGPIDNTHGSGGLGGGRDGGGGSWEGPDPKANTGGGGGGASVSTDQQLGASGVVLVKYGGQAPGIIFLTPVYQPTLSSRVLPGAELKFFVDGSISRAFADGDSEVPLSHAARADAGGYFPPIYLDDETYVAQLKDAAGQVIFGPEDQPQPSIVSIDPSDAPAASGAFTLTVHGTGFTEQSVVRWGGSDRVTIYVSPTELEAAILSGDMAAEGFALVRVFNPQPIGGLSGAKKFTITGALNPVPTIVSLDPNNALAGGVGFTLMVTGTNFVDDSVVRWDGADRSTTFNSDTELEAAILDTDIADDGSANVAVFNPAPGGGESEAAEFTINPATDPNFADVVALLHFDGSDGSTTFTDQIGKTWSAAGNAQLDTAQAKFGSASLLCDGAGDGISTANDSDFDFGSGDFTIEMWLRPSSITNVRNLIAKRVAENFAPFSMLLDAGRIRGRCSVTGSAWAVDITGSAVLSTSAFSHVAFVRNGSAFTQYVNGVADGNSSALSTSALMTNTAGVFVGRTSTDAGDEYAGWIDDLRITKGVARYTANFTPPSAPFPDSAP